MCGLGIQVEGTIGKGFGGKKWASTTLLISSGEVASGNLGNLGATLPMANFLVVHIVRGVASARKDFQCQAFAALIDLKYPCLESLATALSCGLFEARAFRPDV